MRRTALVVLAALSLPLSACTGDQSLSGPRVRLTDGLLATRTADGVALVDGSGEIVRELPGGVPAPDWSAVVMGTPSGEDTSIERVDPSTGRSEARLIVPGHWEVRVVSEWGEVALMAPRATGIDPFAPELRTRTEIAVVDPTDPETLRRYRLPGNFEPEAFSHDSGDAPRSLFSLRYVPSTAPTFYVVTGLTLEGKDDGDVFDVLNALDKGVVENMTSTRLEQELAPDGQRLYTLYTNQPPAYLDDAPSVDPAHTLAFVHALDLEYGFAMCLGLPSEFVGLRPGQVAIAATDGGRVFAIDAAHGQVAIVNVERPRPARVLPLDLTGIGNGPVVAGMSADGSTLLVGAAQGIVAFDARTLDRGNAIGTPGAVTGFASSPDFPDEFLSWDGGLGILDLGDLRISSQLRSPAPGAVEAILAA